jgi:hypothetical protein
MQQYHQEQIGDVLSKAGVLEIGVVLYTLILKYHVNKTKYIRLSVPVSSHQKANARTWNSLDVTLLLVNKIPLRYSGIIVPLDTSTTALNMRGTHIANTR